MDDAPAPPTAPAAPDPTPTGPAAAEAPTGGDGMPDAALVRAGRQRSRARIAGVLLMLFGAFFAFQFAYGAYAASQHATWEQQPGGTLAIDAHGNATVTVQYANGTRQIVQAPPQDAGNITLTRAAAHVTIATANATYTRDVIVPQGAVLPIDLAAGAPATATIGLDPAGYRILWAIALVPALAAASGVAAFKLRLPRLALAGAFAFLVGAAYLFASGGPDLLFRVSLLGTALLCFVFIYQARSQFRRPA